MSRIENQSEYNNVLIFFAARQLPRQSRWGLNYNAPRAIALYCDLAARAALDGMSAQMAKAGFDLGAVEEMAEEVLADEAAAAAAAAN